MIRFLKIIPRGVWLIANLLVASLLLLADCCVYLDPAEYPYIALLGLAFGWLLAANVFFGLSWLFTHHKGWTLLTVLVVAASVPNILHSVSHNTPAKDPQGEHALTVMTYNTCALQGWRNVSENDVLRYVKESGADVVCLEEFAVRKKRITLEDATSYLRAQYPYVYADLPKAKGNFGIAVFSKYPLINTERIDYESTCNQSNRCDVVVGMDTIRLIANHLESNRFVPGDFALDSTERNQDGVRKSIVQFAKKMKVGYSTRAPEVRKVREAIDASPYPVIVAGDMNDVPVSYTYQTLTKGLQDAYLQGSWFQLGHSFTSYLWGARIDYILADKRFYVEYCDLEKVPYSDHYPLTATLSW